jgi:predicted ATP-grasp superfamily ATP-dependent carboligase
MTLLLVGISVRAAAESAAASGYPVLPLDVFGDTDLPSASPGLSLLKDYPDLDQELGSATVRLHASTKELDFDEVVYCSGFENHPECVEEWEREGRTVLGNDAATIRAVRDWEGLFGFLDSRGVLCPETHYVRDPPTFEFGRFEGGDFLVKPARSGGGHGIHPLGDLLGSPSFPTDWVDRPLMVQERLEGRLASLSFTSGENQFRALSTTLQIAGNDSSPYKYLGNIAPLDAPPSVGTRMREIASDIASEFGLRGSNGVDFMLVGGEVYVLEVNPRLQGSLEVVEKASGTHVFEAHVKACRGEPVSPPESRGEGFFGRRVVYAPHEVVVPGLGQTEHLKDVPIPNTHVRGGGPVCTVLAHSTSSGGCQRLLRRREKRVISTLGSPASVSPE